MVTSWLGRAYPVATVISSNVIIDSNNAPPFDCNKVNAQVAAIRQQDMMSGADPLTHYFGLVSDGDGAGMWMRGCSAIPSAPDPTAVGSGPTGNGSWGWDFDGCYGDWYTGHELGHTFGRSHPGSGCGDSSDDPNYPFPAGQLSNADDGYVGFDVGDAALNLPMVAYPGTTWHDVMSYCSNIWISSYTYLGIQRQLVGENSKTMSVSMPAELSGSGAPDRRYPEQTETVSETRSSQGPYVHLVAIINLTRGTGQIEYLTGLLSGESRSIASTSRVSARFVSESGAALAEYFIVPKPQSCTPAGADAHALVDATLPRPPSSSRLLLMVDGNTVDHRGASQHLPAAGDMQSAQHELGSQLTWHAGPDSEPGSITFSVQASSDHGKTWSTLAVGLKSPSFRYDQHLAPAGTQILMRVFATDGFDQSVAATHSIVQH